jgi:predicted dienelactone hydrolase
LKQPGYYLYVVTGKMFNIIAYSLNKYFMKIRIICMLAALFVVLQAAAQPYQLGHISVTFTDSARSNRSVPTEIYYPADAAGNDVAFTTALSGTVPVISFGHGFVMTYDAYFNIRDAVVPNGYIIAFPTTEGSLSPDHNAFGQDLAFVLQAVARLGNTASSPLYNHVDTMTCIMGHSMGGGASFLAMAATPAVKAMVTFAAAETTPSAISAASGITAPSLTFSGLNDCISPPASNQQMMYTALASTCKQYVGIKGGSHCQMAESSVTCSFGEATCTPAPAIAPAAQHAIIDTFLLPWLDHTLKRNCAAGGHFDMLLATDTAITGQMNCTLCTPDAVPGSIAANMLRIYPNPTGDLLHIDALPGSYNAIHIYSVTGQKLMAFPATTNTTIDTRNLPEGLYLYECQSATAQPLRGMFMKR